MLGGCAALHRKVGNALLRVQQARGQHDAAPRPAGVLQGAASGGAAGRAGAGWAWRSRRRHRGAGSTWRQPGAGSSAGSQGACGRRGSGGACVGRSPAGPAPPTAGARWGSLCLPGCRGSTAPPCRTGGPAGRGRTPRRWYRGAAWRSAASAGRGPAARGREAGCTAAASRFGLGQQGCARKGPAQAGGPAQVKAGRRARRAPTALHTVPCTPRQARTAASTLSNRVAEQSRQCLTALWLSYTATVYCPLRDGRAAGRAAVPRRDGRAGRGMTCDPAGAGSAGTSPRSQRARPPRSQLALPPSTHCQARWHPPAPTCSPRSRTSRRRCARPASRAQRGCPSRPGPRAGAGRAGGAGRA